jgi:hypothetical protein
MTDNLDDIRDLAANYSDRQGLRIVPMALALMAQAFPIPSFIFGIDTMLLALAIGLGGYYLIGRYYEWRFGKVEELPYEGTSYLIQILLVLLCIPVAIGLDLVAHPPIFVSGLLIALWLIVTAWPSRRIRGEYLSIGFVLALFSFSPLVGITMPTVGRAYGFWFGFMLLIAAARDHVSFTRLLPAGRTA